MDRIACPSGALARVKEDLMVGGKSLRGWIGWKLEKYFRGRKGIMFTFQRLMSQGLLNLQG